MTPTKDSTERGRILAAETSLYRAMIRKDFAALERILAPDLSYVHSTGVAETKPQYLEGVAKGLYEYESIESREVDIRIYSDVALMTGTVAMSVGERGRKKDAIDLLFALVWGRRADAWQLDYRQATRRPRA